MRSIGLANIPSIANLARVENLAQKFGEVNQVTFLAHHGTAIVEFKEPASVAQAELRMHELKLDDQHLTIIPVRDVKKYKPEYRSSKLNDQPLTKQEKEAVHQFEAANNTLKAHKVARQPKKRIKFGGAPRLIVKPEAEKTNGEDKTGKPKPKSNADFRNYFLTGSTQPPKEKKAETEDAEMHQDGSDDDERPAIKASSKTAAEDIPLDDLLGSGSDDDE